MAAPIKVVVDTHILLQSFFGGEARLLMKMWWQGDLKLCVTDEIVEEYVAAMARLGDLKEEAREIVAAMQDEGKTVRAQVNEKLTTERLSEPLRKFVECAVAAEAEAIIAGDRELLERGGVKGIPVMTPGDWLEERAQRRA